MSRISAVFDKLRGRSEVAFIPYLTAGDPNIDTTVELVLEFERRGADVIELGIPFSDPLADGKANQAAAVRALEAGTTVDSVFHAVHRIREESEIPITLFTYYNIVLRPGVGEFLGRACEAGADGTTIPDLPPDEAEQLIAESDRLGLAPTFFLAPTSTDERMKFVVEACKGFVYYVSLTGVTGAREKLADSVAPNVERIRRFTDLPVCVGFGVSKPKHVRDVASVADGVIVGSAIVKRIGNGLSVTEVGEFVGELAAAKRA